MIWVRSLRVARLADQLGGALGLDQGERQTLHWGALLHDVGKLFVPVGLLNKPAPLTPAERTCLNLHAERGADLLARYPVLPAG
ncbi:HD-GYP domain-containing protein [Deinococcus hopiensis]|uniref:HD-GYP domain-containing protein n=1 Tax=Deinococcus hopiensis TaxID=309885 RepID=UPI001483C2B9|nr:HD domain-containing phosphohydrolase [Deinococcus hopiensis]